MINRFHPNLCTQGKTFRLSPCLTSPVPALHYVQLSASGAAVGGSSLPHSRRAILGAGTAVVRILRQRRCGHARRRALVDQRTGTRKAIDCAADAEANHGAATGAPGRCSVLAAALLRLQCSSEAKRVEKLRYIHRNPVKRGLVDRPEDWLWSSFRHYATGAEGPVELESQWTARRRERSGMPLTIQMSGSQNPRPFAENARKGGAPS
jgi:hypothetical protein